MSFISLAYLIFLPFVTLVHFALAPRSRWFWLLTASCFFYAFFIPRYLLILFFIIGTDYTLGILMESRQGLARRVLLGLSLAINVAVLFAFKYFDFFNSELSVLADSLGLPFWPAVLNWILPIGLSFHTFQALSYTLEVYFGRQKAERHLGVYALYVLFFPQLVAGPIERPQNLLPQLHGTPEFDGDRAIRGLRLILLGVFKKVVLADRLGIFVDGEFAARHITPALSFWFAAFFFAFQIYYDFSAYTDIARGSARILGIELMENFRFPYFSASPREFWTRWHISLSTWFRDYVYIPLGGSRGSRIQTCRNLLIVFLLSGLWHGANMTFVVWGLLHFTFVALPLYFAVRLNIPRALKVVVTFLLVSIAWIFFRAPSVREAWEILMELPLFRNSQWTVFSLPEFRAGLFVIVLFTTAEWFWANGRLERGFQSAPRAVRWAVYYAAVVAIFCFGVFSQKPFIYFQF